LIQWNRMRVIKMKNKLNKQERKDHKDFRKSRKTSRGKGWIAGE